MPRVAVQLSTKSNPGRSSQEGAGKLVNCYAEVNGDEARHKFSVHACNGFTHFATLSGASGGVRAMLAVGSYIYVVAGRILYRVDATGTATMIGGIPTDGPVYMVRNRKEPFPQIGIVSDGLYYVCEGSTLVEVADADLPEATSVAVLNGYFLLPGRANRWYITGIDDATAIDGLDFAKAESSPDSTLRVMVRGNEAIFLGERSLEFWQDTSTGDFPFSRVTAINIGCYAAGSAVNATVVRGESIIDALIWAGTDNEGAFTGVFLATGYQPAKISDYWVDRAIRDEPDPTSIRASSWNADGHSFYVISGSSFSACWDSLTGWHHRQSYGLERWRVQYVTAFAGMIIGGDYATGNLYRIFPGSYAEASDPLVMTVQTPPVHAFPNEAIVNALHVDCVTGVGAGGSDGHSAEPMMMISWSDDGETFGPERMISMGQAGQTQTRVTTRRLGKSKRGRTFRMSVSAAVVRTIMAASADVEVLK